MFSWLSRSRRPPEASVPRPDGDHRIYAIGDVHGRVELLDALLARIEADLQTRDDHRQPILLFLGDLVDRGDHTRDTIDRALVTTLTWPRVVVLRGNHEAAMMAFLAAPRDGAAWLKFGGRQTLASYGVEAPPAGAGAAEIEAAAATLARRLDVHERFLRETVPMFRSGDVVFAHAGIDPARPLDAQDERALLWGESRFLEDGPPEGLRVVHGHWATGEPVVTRNRINIDTGAYYSGQLTAVRLDSDTEILAVDVLGA